MADEKFETAVGVVAPHLAGEAKAYAVSLYARSEALRELLSAHPGNSNVSASLQQQLSGLIGNAIQMLPHPTVQG